MGHGAKIDRLESFVPTGEELVQLNTTLPRACSNPMQTTACGRPSWSYYYGRFEKQAKRVQAYLRCLRESSCRLHNQATGKRLICGVLQVCDLCRLCAIRGASTGRICPEAFSGRASNAHSADDGRNNSVVRVSHWIGCIGKFRVQHGMPKHVADRLPLLSKSVSFYW